MSDLPLPSLRSPNRSHGLTSQASLSRPRPLPLLCGLSGLRLSCPLSSPLSRPTAIPPSPPESPRLWYSSATWMLRGVAGPLATFAECRLVLVRTANGDGGLWSCGNNRRACVRACSCVCVRACLFGRACVGARARAWVRVCPSCAPAEPHGVQPEAARARHQPGRMRSVACARRSFLQGADQERGRRCAALQVSKEPKDLTD